MGSYALVFPPLWYFPAVPADLTHTGGALAARGHSVAMLDLSAGLHHRLLGHTAAWARLRDPASYRGDLRPVGEALWEACARVPTRAAYRPQSLRLRADPDDVVASRAVALDPDENPALPLLWETAERLAGERPDVIAIALVHPDQKQQVPALARLLRQHGYSGTVAIYGSLEDVLAPSDFAEDLLGGHALFDDVDGVVLGEAESALAALLEGTPVPNWLTARSASLPPRHVEELTTLGPPRFDGIDPGHYPTPTPTVDLRLGRGCPWARCTFCAIQAHQTGYRAGPAERVADAVQAAHHALGATHFRVRDDLVTPVQLRALGRALRSAPYATWVARSRFEAALTRDVLDEARRGGLSELWVGLESGSERVRALMDKGVKAHVIERILTDSAAIGLRVRALCIAGFPTETEAEFDETARFLDVHRDRLCGFALTPFQVMRSAPMLADLGRFGVRLRVDPLPRSTRLRHQVPVEPFDPSPEQIERRVARVVAQHAERAEALGGLGPVHAWWQATP